LCQLRKITRIRGENSAGICGQQRHGGIDDVAAARASEEYTGLLSELVVQRHYVDARQYSCYRGVSAGSTAPNLPDYTTMGDGLVTGQQLPFNECGNLANTTFNCDKRAG